MSIQSEIQRIQNNVNSSLATVAAYGVEVPAGANSNNLPRLIADIAEAVQVKPEYAESVEWLNENGDTGKMYVLPDGYIYAYMYGESTGKQYTNLFESTTINLNKRWSSSGSMKDANGYIATDAISVKADDVIRIKPASAVQGVSGGYSRVKYYDESGTQRGMNNSDSAITREHKVTIENDVASFVVGWYNTTLDDSSTNTRSTYADSIVTMKLGLYVSDSAITETDIADFVLTVNEEIKEGTVSGYSWKNTSHAFVPADYEERIVELENKAVEHGDKIAELGEKVNNNKTSLIESGEIFAPAPQLPADATDNADFNADDMTAQEIYDYLDVLCAKYPNYITKETLGKDASGKYDVNRYVLCKHYYSAWQRQNYPKMYGWVNGSTVIYSVSVSPRIGDALYTTAYIGTKKGTVTAVSNANESRTVGGVVYTRDVTKDIDPTLVYTSILADTAGSTVYNVSKGTVTTISGNAGKTMTGANGITYTRYPMGDRDNDMTKFPVTTIGANEHAPNGDPREPAIVCARMMKDLCECKSSNNALLNHLKNNVMLVIMPIINPFGFNKGSNGSSLDGYYNSNNVNINRNYDTPGWGNDTTAGGQGEYGGSEIETQYFMNTIVEAVSAVAISVHCLGSVKEANRGLCHYQGNGFNSAKLRKIAEAMNANYNLKFTSYGSADPAASAKSPSYITQAGAKGGIIEMNDYDVNSGSYHSDFTMEANYTLLLECICMWLSDSV